MLEIYGPIVHLHSLKLEVETEKGHNLGNIYLEKHPPTQFQKLKG